jgi:hypothetical protein
VAPLRRDAQVARFDARRLRHECESLKQNVRDNLDSSRAHLVKAHDESSRARANRAEPLPSPWSELRWNQAYETLELTLVPVPPRDR